MATCAGGAHPTGGFVEFSVAIQGVAIGATMWEFVTGFWPAAAASAVLAQIPLTKLCDMNPDDPGDFDWNQMVADWFTSGVPGFDSQPGTLAYWVFQKALYQEFSKYCICNDTTTPPPPIVVTPPPGDQWAFPPGPDNQPILKRIEHNTAGTADGQTLLYQGMQVVATHMSDLWSWHTPNYTQPGSPFSTLTLSGEGYQSIPYYGSGPERYVLIAGIKTRIAQFPSVYKQRGTLNPRYYGIGSVYWDSRYYPSDPQLTSKRESIHYREQVLAAPRDWVPVGISWHLQPGAVVQLDYIIRQPQAPGVPWYQPNDDAFQSFSGLSIPSHVSDPPLWPPPTSTALSTTTSTPYRISSPP